MNRQSSEGRQSASTRSPAEHPRHSENGKTFSYRSTEIDKTSVVKKQPPIPRKPARNEPVKVFTRESGPGQSIVQRTDPGNEREIAMSKLKSPKHMRVVASLLNMSDQQSSEGDSMKPATAAGREESRGSQRKQSGVFNRRVEIYSRSKNGTPNSYTPINVDKNKTEISDAIFERDEVDEEDYKDPHQPNQNVSIEEKRALSTDQAILAQQEYFNHEPLVMKRGVSDSPGMKGYNGIYKFPENLMDSSMMSMNKSTEGGSLPGSRPATNVRGAFMNEHITLTEMEKQKEKQRKMREALDSQLNEKKMKQHEEKMKQDELNKKEEMRIKREMEQLKTLHEKETAYENLRKGHMKTEENEIGLNNRSIVKPASAMQVEIPEKTYTESDALNTSTNQANMSFQPTNEKLIITPVRVRGKTESRTTNSKDVFESRSHGSPAKITNDVNILVDENKKLRDENTKKEELIDALIMALKHKEGTAAAAAQNLQDKTNLYTTPKKETPAPSVITAKPTKPVVNTGEAETDFYGYYLNGYMQPKQKFQANSEQPSAAHTRYEVKDLSYSIAEEKNFSINVYDKADMKDYKPKVIRKAMPDYMMEPSSAGISSQNNTPYYRLAMGNSLSGLFGNNRGYSSPLAGGLNGLNKSVFTTPSHKLDVKNSPYMPLIASNAGNLSMNLEPMKSVSQGNLITKSHITPPEMMLNPSGSSLFRMKKRHEHSVDVMETPPHDLALERKIPSERPAINIIDEEGTYAMTKPNPMPRREYADLIHPYSSPNYGIHDYKKLEIIDTSNYPEKPALKAHSMSVNPSPHDTPTEHGNNYQLKLFGKIALYGSGGAFDKRVMSEDLGKDKWALGDMLKKTKKEEMFEKSKGLPSLESKSKFPKEVFPSNLKKKICH